MKLLDNSGYFKVPQFSDDYLLKYYFHIMYDDQNLVAKEIQNK